MLHILILEPHPDPSTEGPTFSNDRLIISVIPQGPVLPVDLYNLRIRKFSYPPLKETSPESSKEAVAVRPLFDPGVVIADATGLPWVVGALQSQLSEFAPWIAYHQGNQAFVVCSRSPEYSLGKSFPSQLFCLKCLEEGLLRGLRSDAKHPFCKQHQEYSPHRWNKATPT
jgi:hypothetical protein